MNPKNTVLIGIVVLAIIGGIVYTNRAKTDDKTMMEKTPVAQETAMMEKKENTETPGTMMKKTSRYTEYSKSAFDEASGSKRVYFFHATWCPSCKATNAEIMGNPDGIPEDVILFKTDYDTNSDLKKQYGVTYQHTFVLVDATGKEIKQWNGGGLTELADNTK